LAKNSKAKINRTLKNYGIDLSNEVSIPTNIESFKSRKEFNEWKEKAESFTNRNNLRFQFVKNKFGVVASKSELNKIQRDTERARRIAEDRKKKLENAPFVSGGKVQGTVGERVRMMANPNTKGISIPVKFDFNKIHSFFELRKRKESMEKKANPRFYDERAERFKDLYMRSLEEMFNSDADGVIERLQKVSGADFYELYQMFDEFEPVFDPSPQKGLDANGMWIDESASLRQLDQIEKYLDQFLAGKIDVHLKGF
jgi:hypothetical protein